MGFNIKDASAGWLGVAIISMACMGGYAFLIVLSRAPGFNLLFTEQDFFYTALVTHVVLSIVIWFLAFILFVIYNVTADHPAGLIDRAMAACALLGVVFVVATPFTGPAWPQLNNYVPTLNRDLYFTGLAVFFGFATMGVALRTPTLIKALIARGDKYPLAVYGSLAGAGLSLAIGVLCMAIAKSKLGPFSETEIDPRLYYELLFWGGGHVLQFTNTFGVMAGWSLLYTRLSGEKLVSDKVALLALVVMIGFAIVAPFQYIGTDVESLEQRQFFTNLKGWGLALGPIIFGASVVFKRAKMKRDDIVAYNGLLISISLFALGGLIALTINGSDTRVPAHYHGVIGGVTMCYMTLGLMAIVDNGWLAAGGKWLKRQVKIYGAGQGLFVVGMFIGGVLGLARKTYGQAQVLDTVEKIFSMGVMGIGGLLAITGGGLFVTLMTIGLIRGFKKSGNTQASV